MFWICWLFFRLFQPSETAFDASAVHATLRGVILRMPHGQGGRLLSVATLLVCVLMAAGCGTIARKTASGVTSLATGTIKIAGKATGKIAVATIKASGQAAASVGKASGQALLDLTKAGAVTFVDATTGLVSSIPFVDGMSLNSALTTSKLDSRLKVFEIIRPSQVLKIGWQQLIKLGGAQLRSGDVIRVIQLTVK